MPRALLPLIDADTDAAVAAAGPVLESFADRYPPRWRRGMHAKLGLSEDQPDDGALVDDLLALLRAGSVDFTSCFRALSSAARGDAQPARSLFADPAGFDAWSERWLSRLPSEASERQAIADAMDRVNPLYIPRNHLVEEALEAATAATSSRSTG